MKSINVGAVFLVSAFLLLGSAMAGSKTPSGLHENIPMGAIEGTELSINIAFPNNVAEAPRPVVILIHGGGYISGDKSDKNRQIRKLSEMGFVAASAMYRLSPEFRFPAAIEDIKLAVRFLKANAAQYHIDPERILVSGSSAGSYLAVMVGVTGNTDVFSDHGLYPEVDSTVRAVAAQSAPIGDFTLKKYAHRPTVKRLAPKKRASKASLKAMSPITYLDRQDPPFFLSHGDSDPLVPVSMSREFAKALSDIGHTYQFHEVKGGTHDFSSSAPQQAKAVFAEYIKFLSSWSR